MKPTERTEQFVAQGKPHLKMNERAEQRLLLDAAGEMKRAIERTSRQRRPYRSVTMRSRTLQIAAALMLVAAVLAVTPSGQSTALGRVVAGLTTTLDQLRAWVLGEKIDATGPQLPALPEGTVTFDPSQVVQIDFKVFTITGSDDPIESFLSPHNIEFTSEHAVNGEYAVIRAAEADAALRFLHTCGAYDVLQAPRLEMMNNEEGVIGATGISATAVRIAVADDGTMHVYFAYHDTEAGCQINGVQLGEGQKLLIRSGDSSQEATRLLMFLAPQVP